MSSTAQQCLAPRAACGASHRHGQGFSMLTSVQRRKTVIYARQSKRGFGKASGIDPITGKPLPAAGIERRQLTNSSPSTPSPNIVQQAAPHIRQQGQTATSNAASNSTQKLLEKIRKATARQRREQEASAPDPNHKQVYTLPDSDVLVVRGYENDFAGLPAAVSQLQGRLQAGVDAERAEQRRAARHLYDPGSLPRLQAEGLALGGLQGSPDGVLHRSTVWKFHLPHHGDLPSHRFKQGDSVTVTALGAKRGRQKAAGDAGRAPEGSARGVEEEEFPEGVVLEVGKGVLRVSLEKEVSDWMEGCCGPGALWRIDRSLVDVTARRQLDAVKGLGAFLEASRNELLVRAILLGAPSGSRMAVEVPPWVEDPSWRRQARAELAAQPHLNDSQREAIAKALIRSFTLWQGPPGTGKTWTLLAMMEVLVRASSRSAVWEHSMGSILAAADTNAAADNLVAGLQERRVQVVRVGVSAKVRLELRHLSLDSLAEATPAGQTALKLREVARKVEAYLREVREGRVQESTERVRQLRKKLRDTWAESDEQLRAAEASVLDGAQVVVATCTGCGDSSLRGRVFRMVVVDEASQATEPSTLIPLLRGAHCVVLAGDPRQLPPTVTSSEALRYGLAIPLFERLADSCGLAPMLLNVQYRMHPGVAAFPNRWFYAGLLRDGTTAESRPPPSGIPWPQSATPVAFIQVKGREARGGQGRDAAGGPAEEGGGSSIMNRAEAEVAAQAAYAMLAAGDVESVAVLTPYRAQVRLLEQLLAGCREQLGAAEGQLLASSVDGYQGREAEAVVLTTVRCNPRAQLGFVADRRRLNVAITRPKRGLLVVGDSNTLRHSVDWAAFLQWVEEGGLHLHPHTLPALPAAEPQQLPQQPWPPGGKPRAGRGGRRTKAGGADAAQAAGTSEAW